MQSRPWDWGRGEGSPVSELILQALYSGLLVGGVYALIALGLALTFGTMRVINLAHGELVLLAAYMAYVVENRLQLNPVFAVPLAVLVACTCSAVIYLLVDRIRKNRELNSLMLTFAIGIVINPITSILELKLSGPLSKPNWSIVAIPCVPFGPCSS